ncbi:MAG TPA: hypothetical protein VLV86_04690, partial [Vicinamibacterales bacterium]|nr:hypothetical protein [Vicinamibacterales bacterium]
ALPSSNKWTRDMDIEGITVMHTGQPFTPVLSLDNSNSGNTGGSTAGLDRPNLIGNPDLSNPTANEWFNTAAFAIPAPYTFGNAGRNSLRGPGFASFDVAVSKRLPTNRRVGTTIQLQVFNLFNKTNFNLPGNDIDVPATFGRILSAQAARQVQLSVRLGL